MEILQRPVTGEQLFNREELIETLQGSPQNIALIGPRKSGKTSLMWEVRPKLEGKGILCPYIYWNPLHPLQGYTGKNLQKKEHGKVSVHPESDCTGKSYGKRDSFRYSEPHYIAACISGFLATDGVNSQNFRWVSTN